MGRVSCPQESREILDRYLTLKMLFLLALSSAKRMDELHGLSAAVRHFVVWHYSLFLSSGLRGQNPESLCAR